MTEFKQPSGRRRKDLVRSNPRDTAIAKPSRRSKEGDGSQMRSKATTLIRDIPFRVTGFKRRPLCSLQPLLFSPSPRSAHHLAARSINMSTYQHPLYALTNPACMPITPGLLIHLEVSCPGSYFPLMPTTIKSPRTDKSSTDFAPSSPPLVPIRSTAHPSIRCDRGAATLELDSSDSGSSPDSSPSDLSLASSWSNSTESLPTTPSSCPSPSPRAFTTLVLAASPIARHLAAAIERRHNMKPLVPLQSMVATKPMHHRPTSSQDASDRLRRTTSSSAFFSA